MENYIKNIIPNIKQYGKLLSQKEYFINKTWLLINDSSDLVQYTFKKNSELIISVNGDVQKGKWELLSSSKILIESPIGNIQLENLFFNKDIIVLLKPSLIEELFVLINEDVIKDKNPFEYLKNLEKSNNEEIEPDDDYLMIFGIGLLIVFVLIIFSIIIK
jgi:hypothetical protein